MKITNQGWFSSFSGVIVAIVTLLGITGVAFASGGAMFTPGSLNSKPGAPMGGITSHAEIQQCSACHAAPWDTDTMADRCLVCHTDITAQLQDPTSLHSLVRFGQTDLNCRTCHTEHHGPTATLTRIPPGWDPHDQLGFSLKAHRLRMDGTPFECKDCHENGYKGPFDQAICANCHLKIDPVFTQGHILTFWTDCQACHDGVDTRGKNFDHNQVPFHLAGIHALTECSKCHVNARKLSDLKTTSQDCYTCHAKDDQHQGRFGTKCGVCHNPEGWSKSAQFDHDLAAFKLRGLHLKVACAKCHINNVYKGIPMDCVSCHQKDDKHAGSFGSQCELCHVADGWNRAVDHSKFAFKLDGKHATVACESCHINAVFNGTPMECVSCHKKDDAHAGQLGDKCDSCHTPENWTSATFNHNTVSFKLTAHKTKSDGTAFVCKDCHVKNYASPFDQNICGNCHLQINQAFAAEHFLTFGTNCMACHDGIDSHGSNFDHNRFPFNLVGKHALAACSNCHLSDRTIPDMQATSQQCYSCHQKDDFHNGQFGTDCSACHVPDGWKPAKVDHSKFAFHLDGTHATVACEKCHINGVFKGTPQDCGSCHTKDDAHQGQLGTQCGDCHIPDGWKPAKVDHSKFAFKLDGKHATTACTDCHKNNDFKGTPTDCAACHLKDDAHAGSLGTQCGTCHSPAGWSPATFDHNTVSFKLTAHKTNSDGTAFACKDCHVKGYAAPFDQNTCGNCHLQINQAFATEHFLTFGTNCMACHDGVESHGKTFDHNKVPFNLNGKHASVACAQCHVNAHTIAGLQATAQTCFSCHAKDDHHNGQFGTDCAACHVPDGWTLAKVDHSQFAFHLDGVHATVACEKCHINGVFKGTPQDCASCHTKDDAHQGQLGTQCGTCHTPDGWKPAKVDHSTFAFKLDGIHATAACTDCHKDNLFKNTPMDCAACHLKDDAHAGSLGTQCGTCHSPTGWSPATFDHNSVSFKLTAHQTKSDGTAFACKDCHAKGYAAPFDQNTCGDCHLQINQTFATEHFLTFGTNCMACHDGVDSHGKTFDHNKVPFNLIGKHGVVVCSQCHVNAHNLHDLKATSQVCFSCHAKDDHHNGQFGTDCAACHSPEGWQLATVNHSLFAFHLDGKHSTVACESCHQGGVFKGTPTDCGSCHTKDDAHQGQLGTQCGTCHTPDGWKPAKVDHSTFAFHLDGQHAAVACANCHKDNLFKGTPTDCASCHLKDDAHSGQFGTLCATCHTPDGWKPAKVDHSKFAFKLDGIHATVACTDCHKNNDFKGTPTDCASCHLKDDAHSGQFGTLCATCHTPDAWKPAKVDHSKFTFKLDGIHATTACTDCHKNNDFKGTPTDCAACHLKDDAHAGSLGTQCGTCHSPAGWNPATFDHNSVSFKLSAHKTNSDGTAFACKDCHVKGYAAPFDQNTCGNCHLQINQAFATEHFLTFGTNCMACHDGVESHGKAFDHNKVPFNLIGKHGSIACSQCHVNAHTIADLQATAQTCFSCHAKDDHHNGQFGTDCAACHSPEGWALAKVDHSQFAFHLDGVHATVACEKCHINGVFKGTPQDCASCHTKDDAHSGQLGTQCGTCHTPDGWKPAKVDHSTFAFKLDGQHAAVACVNCHINGVFKGTPTDCASCHTKDDAHQGTYGNQCATCHNPTDWKQVSFDHNTTRFKLTAHKNNQCKDCHQNGFVSPFDQNTCGNCHLQINQTFATEHFLTFGTNCIACHDGVDSHGSSFNHNQVPFNLIGKHATVTCSQCHVSARNLHDLKATSQDCFSCHAKDDHHNGQFGTDCAACHSPEGWQLATVDHSLFAFHLDGKHSTVACESCHQGGVFKGTPTDCASCHSKNDPHGGALGNQCDTCHTPNGWKPSSFDHNNSIFKLTGQHVNVVCSNCHTDLKFKGTPTDCASCHTKIDPHAGKLGTQCASCHTTSGWTPSTFDHSSSAFPLIGLHTSVACSQCHLDKFFVGTPKDCVSCHSKDDAHSGGLGTQCATCHSPTGWKPSTFNHNNAAFHLDGQHTGVACTSCHINGVLKGTPTDCASCHSKNDPHSGALGTQCATCHTTSGWKPSTFNHASSIFKLTGAHTTVLCASCHTDLKFKGTPTTCYACHAANDHHGGKFGTNCAACHSTTAWKPATFDHSLSAFPLTGAHTNVSCDLCHINGVFTGTPKDCVSCHSKTDPHGGALPLCATCHTTSAWKPTTFNHANAPFTLTGAHTTVACASCHKNLLYKSTSTTCNSCHVDPAFHAGSFGTVCQTCHNTVAWIPAQLIGYTHAKHNGQTMVNHQRAICKDCHTTTVKVWSCLKCHDSNNPN